MSEAIAQFSVPLNRSLEAAAGEFRTKVEDAASRLNAAAEQFVTMSDGLLAAAADARQAAEKAEQAQRSVAELEERMARDYGNVSELVRDLQQRIAALAVLGQALPTPATAEPEAEPEQETVLPEPQPLRSWSGGPGESSW
jgi:chromosome segregation ATPase